MLTDTLFYSVVSNILLILSEVVLISFFSLNFSVGLNKSSRKSDPHPSQPTNNIVIWTDAIYEHIFAL